MTWRCRKLREVNKGGRPHAWKNGETISMRVPRILKPAFQRLAHYIDDHDLIENEAEVIIGRMEGDLLLDLSYLPGHFLGSHEVILVDDLIAHGLRIKTKHGGIQKQNPQDKPSKEDRANRKISKKYFFKR